ncbi:MAG: hypothetical protein MUF10_11250 [Thermoanaerobaculaceae bacterium]|jgi:hypothetical protein|nr:hypothetical protein [Thermoanaerobaculaceae bacterium]
MLTFLFERTASYLVTHVYGFNADWAGANFVNGVAGPVSAEEARRLACAGCRTWKVLPGHAITWRQRGDMWEAFYEPEAPADPSPDPAPPRRTRSKL